MTTFCVKALSFEDIKPVCRSARGKRTMWIDELLKEFKKSGDEVWHVIEGIDCKLEGKTSTYYASSIQDYIKKYKVDGVTATVRSENLYLIKKEQQPCLLTM